MLILYYSYDNNNNNNNNNNNEYTNTTSSLLSALSIHILLTFHLHPFAFLISLYIIIINVYTATSKGAIEKILATTEGDLQLLNRQVSEELQRALTKEKYVNHQFAHLSSSFSDHKKELEKLEKVSEEANERVAKMSNELADITERVDELKENFDSKGKRCYDDSRTCLPK
jgi:hypothetical protein